MTNAANTNNAPLNAAWAAARVVANTLELNEPERAVDVYGVYTAEDDDEWPTIDGVDVIRLDWLNPASALSTTLQATTLDGDCHDYDGDATDAAAVAEWVRGLEPRYTPEPEQPNRHIAMALEALVEKRRDLMGALEFEDDPEAAAEMQVEAERCAEAEAYLRTLV